MEPDADRLAGTRCDALRYCGAADRPGRAPDATRDRSPYLAAAASTGMDPKRDRTGDAPGRRRVIDR